MIAQRKKSFIFSFFPFLIINLLLYMFIWNYLFDLKKIDLKNYLLYEYNEIFKKEEMDPKKIFNTVNDIYKSFTFKLYHSDHQSKKLVLDGEFVKEFVVKESYAELKMESFLVSCEIVPDDTDCIALIRKNKNKNYWELQLYDYLQPSRNYLMKIHLIWGGVLNIFIFILLFYINPKIRKK